MNEDTEFVPTCVSWDLDFLRLGELKIIDLNIGDGCQKVTTPVNESISSIDIFFFVQSNETFINSLAEFIIHGEMESAIIERTSKSLKLLKNNISMFFLPFPDFVNELFSSKIPTSNSLSLLQMFFNNCMSSNTSMILSRKIKTFITLHSLSSDNTILYCSSQTVTNMKISSNVWGW